jgi:hypothetical protein
VSALYGLLNKFYILFNSTSMGILLYGKCSEPPVLVTGSLYINTKKVVFTFNFAWRSGSRSDGKHTKRTVHDESKFECTYDWYSTNPNIN